MIRTEEEILERIRSIEDKTALDVLGFGRSVFFEYLSFENLDPHIQEDWLGDRCLDDWEPKPLTREGILADMKEYMAFSWEKVIDHRGLSANRSVDKMRAWCWLLGCEEKIDWDNYAQFGAPILDSVCWLLGFDIPASPQVSNMIRGKKCVPGCARGCPV